MWVVVAWWFAWVWSRAVRRTGFAERWSLGAGVMAARQGRLARCPVVLGASAVLAGGGREGSEFRERVGELLRPGPAGLEA